MNYLKRHERIMLVLIIVIAIFLIGLSIATFGKNKIWASKTLMTSGLILTISGLIQFEVSGLFDLLAEKYGDDSRFPYGPPSHITREIIGPFSNSRISKLRNVLFFERKSGFWLIIIGTVVQIVATWI